LLAQYFKEHVSFILGNVECTHLQKVFLNVIWQLNNPVTSSQDRREFISFKKLPQEQAVMLTQIEILR